MSIPREVWISHENDRLLISYESDAAADVVAVANLSLTGAATIDGVVLTNGKVVLATAQTTVANCGLWIVNTSGAWTRQTPFQSQSVLIGSGTLYVGTLWNLTATNTYTQKAILVQTGRYIQSFSPNTKFETKKFGQPGATRKDTEVIPDGVTLQCTALYDRKLDQYGPFLDSKKKYKLEFSLNNPQYDGNSANQNEQDDHVYRYCTVTDLKITMSDDKVLEVALTLEAEYEE